MRRKDREITDRKMIDDIIRNSQVVRIALKDENYPYIVPLCYGYDGTNLYFHCAYSGRKIDLLKKDNRICFEIDTAEGVRFNESKKSCTMLYKSVIGNGEAFFIENIKEKIEALDLIMEQYNQDTFEYPEIMLAKTCLVKIIIREITGKQNIT